VKNNRYLYRGKIVGEDTWVQGNLLFRHGQWFIQYENDIGFLFTEQIYEDSICQHVKDGFFEKDIIKFDYKYMFGDKFELKGYIYWDEENLCFSIFVTNNGYFSDIKLSDNSISNIELLGILGEED
jgi:hypothetical protein